MQFNLWQNATNCKLGRILGGLYRNLHQLVAFYLSLLRRFFVIGVHFPPPVQELLLHV